MVLKEGFVMLKETQPEENPQTVQDDQLDNLSSEQNQILENEAVEITKNIVNSVKVDDEDTEFLKSKQETEFQFEFDSFLNKKLEISNDGDDAEKISTGIDLIDCLTGGGFTIGQFIQFAGLPGSFKSTLMAQILGNAQKQYNGKLLAVYYDTEVAMTQKRLIQLGVNNPPMKPYDDVTVETLFKTIEAMCAYKEAKNIETPSVIVWDSIANTSTTKERSTDEINQTMGLKQKLLSQLFPRYLPKMKKYKICLWGVNQLRDKLDVGMYGPPPDLAGLNNYDVPGGKAIKFNSSMFLKLQNRGEFSEDQYGFKGRLLEGIFIKNKSFSPLIKFNLIASFAHGISNFWTNYKLLAENKRMQTGAWNKLLVLPKKTFRTKDAQDLYNSDEEFRQAFDTELKDVLKTVYIDKYS